MCPLPARLVLHFDIADRQQELRDTVAPDDFVLLRRDTPHEFPACALAYCADMQAERVLYTLHSGDLPALFAAPFLYAAQLPAASAVVSVPFERLAELEPEDCTPSPTLIFSPGRTGSTLLARVLLAAGKPCASEPDMLAQVCRFEREDRRRIGLDMEEALQRACLVSLCRALGPAPFIKLRSHCNARPLPILQAAPAANAVFMLRRRHEWAASRHRAFGENPASVAAVLRQAVDALDKLAGAGQPFHVLWFDDLVRDPANALRGLGVAEVNAAAIEAAMAQDAQAGTAVARAHLAGLRVDSGFEAAFDAAWDAARAGAEWGSVTQTHLAAMDDLAKS
jgi:hypothetical protein